MGALSSLLNILDAADKLAHHNKGDNSLLLRMSD